MVLDWIAILGVVGGVLSIILSAVAIYDRWLKKPIPEITYCFRSLASEGNDIIIANGNPEPILIEYWELYWAKPEGRIGLRTTVEVADTLDGESQFVIPPYSFHRLNFVENNHFDWGSRTAQRGSLMIDLAIVGRSRRIEFLVYESSMVSSEMRLKEAFRLKLPRFLRPKRIKR